MTKISVVCPFYNEEAILEASIRLMLKNLSTLKQDWELIFVNDGSKDRSLEIAQSIKDPHLRIVSYPVNHGRGYALRTGVAAATGEIVVTTESDSSWGDDIVHRIVAEFEKKPDADIIIASPHLPGGGYKNVPAHRVFLSSFGNYVIRSGLTYKVTMNTGMTRGYRREKYLALPLDENGKEMHLEIVNKALAFGYRIYEIPAVLEWKDQKLSTTPLQKRKSSSKINMLIRTHLLFSILAAPFRYLYLLSALLLAVAAALFCGGIYNLYNPEPSIYLFIISLLLALFAVFFFGIGVLAQQNRAVAREIWHMRRELRDPNRSL